MGNRDLEAWGRSQRRGFLKGNEPLVLRIIREFIENMLDAGATLVEIAVDYVDMVVTIKSDARPFQTNPLNIQLSNYLNVDTIAPDNALRHQDEDEFGVNNEGGRLAILVLREAVSIISIYNHKEECSVGFTILPTRTVDSPNGVTIQIAFGSQPWIPKNAYVHLGQKELREFLEQYWRGKFTLNGESIRPRTFKGLEEEPLNARKMHQFDEIGLRAYKTRDVEQTSVLVSFGGRAQRVPSWDFYYRTKDEGDKDVQMKIVFLVEWAGFKKVAPSDKLYNPNNTNRSEIHRVEAYIQTQKLKLQTKYVGRHGPEDKKDEKLTSFVRDLWEPLKDLFDDGKVKYDPKGDDKVKYKGHRKKGTNPDPNPYPAFPEGDKPVKRVSGLPIRDNPMTGFSETPRTQTFGISMDYSDSDKFPVAVINWYKDIDGDTTIPKQQDIFRRATPQALSMLPSFSPSVKEEVRRIGAELVGLSRDNLDLNTLKERLKSLMDVRASDD